MTFIKSLILPFGICAALLAPRYELWWLDATWSAALHGAYSDRAARDSAEFAAGLGAYSCLPCGLVLPADEDVADGD
jgi:hypothetical protein